MNCLIDRNKWVAEGIADSAKGVGQINNTFSKKSIFVTFVLLEIFFDVDSKSDFFPTSVSRVVLFRIRHFSKFVQKVSKLEIAYVHKKNYFKNILSL